jgi:flavin reductase (DIM6/NTAB) family NADH-FMN oxidoreductase RutF
MVEQTDYFGPVSGREVDKGELVDTFYGQLETAPMIVGCPINMVCRLIQTIEFPKHDVFIGEIIEAYCDEECLTVGGVDFGRVQPILFAMSDRSYWRLGEQFAKAWDVGKTLKDR